MELELYTVAPYSPQLVSSTPNWPRPEQFEYIKSVREKAWLDFIIQRRVWTTNITLLFLQETTRPHGINICVPIMLRSHNILAHILCMLSIRNIIPLLHKSRQNSGMQFL